MFIYVGQIVRIKSTSKQELYKTVMDIAPQAREAWATKNYTVKQRTQCAPTMLWYARGTMEPGENGVTLEPPLVAAGRGLGCGIRSIGYNNRYTASIADDFCVALPDGEVCYKILKQLGSSCPSSNFLLAGYSQGAMVARICAAYQSPEIRNRIKVGYDVLRLWDKANRCTWGLVLFGDAMNGADMRGIRDDRVHTVCRDDDGVCKGKSDITMGHLAYNFNPKTIPDAIAWMKSALAR